MRPLEINALQHPNGALPFQIMKRGCIRNLKGLKHSSSCGRIPLPTAKPSLGALKAQPAKAPPSNPKQQIEIRACIGAKLLSSAANSSCSP
jgi:hypothetical protein